MKLNMIEAGTGKGHTAVLKPVTNILDQGCPTDAPNFDFFVNTEGELCRGSDYLHNVSVVNIGELARQKGIDLERVWANRKSAYAKRWEAIIQQEFADRRSETLTVKENLFTEKVFALQGAADFGRFRVYGGIRKGRDVIVLVTEFLALVSEENIWQQIEVIRKKTKARLWVMTEDTRSDHSYRVHPDGHGSDKYGPGHGELERQVELSWRIEKLTPTELKAFIKVLKKETQKVWKLAGVGVC
jgi:hypothetical protein